MECTWLRTTEKLQGSHLMAAGTLSNVAKSLRSLEQTNKRTCKLTPALTRRNSVQKTRRLTNRIVYSREWPQFPFLKFKVPEFHGCFRLRSPRRAISDRGTIEISIHKWHIWDCNWPIMISARSSVSKDSRFHKGWTPYWECRNHSSNKQTCEELLLALTNNGMINKNQEHWKPRSLNIKQRQSLAAASEFLTFPVPNVHFAAFEVGWSILPKMAYRWSDLIWPPSEFGFSCCQWFIQPSLKSGTLSRSQLWLSNVASFVLKFISWEFNSSHSLQSFATTHTFNLGIGMYIVSLGLWVFILRQEQICLKELPTQAKTCGPFLWMIWKPKPSTTLGVHLLIPHTSRRRQIFWDWTPDDQTKTLINFDCVLSKNERMDHQKFFQK